MASDANILSTAPEINYVERAPKIDPKEFQKVVSSRRSVRVFDGTPIPEKVMHQCLENALLAPNSSNLQPWEFYWVKDRTKRSELVKACFSQTAAATAAEIVVCVARTDTWKSHAVEMVELFEKSGEAPALALKYYRKIVPLVYSQGFMGVLGFLKRILFAVRGISTPTPREPVSNAQLRLWAVKTTALGAENLMLSLRALGFDSCAMEGYDSLRVRRILELPRNATVVMAIAAGKRAKGGIYGPRIRFDPSRFIKIV